MSIPNDLAQLRHIELLERALAVTDHKGSDPERAMGKMSRDQLIAYIMERRERRAARGWERFAEKSGTV